MSTQGTSIPMEKTSFICQLPLLLNRGIRRATIYAVLLRIKNAKVPKLFVSDFTTHESILSPSTAEVSLGEQSLEREKLFQINIYQEKFTEFIRQCETKFKIGKKLSDDTYSIDVNTCLFTKISLRLHYYQGGVEGIADKIDLVNAEDADTEPPLALLVSQFFEFASENYIIKNKKLLENLAPVDYFKTASPEPQESSPEPTEIRLYSQPIAPVKLEDSLSGIPRFHQTDFVSFQQDEPSQRDKSLISLPEAYSISEILSLDQKSEDTNIYSVNAQVVGIEPFDFQLCPKEYKYDVLTSKYNPDNPFIRSFQVLLTDDTAFPAQNVLRVYFDKSSIAELFEFESVEEFFSQFHQKRDDVVKEMIHSRKRRWFQLYQRVLPISKDNSLICWIPYNIQKTQLIG